jgi:enoyl-CoA hydratase/carnithine racemase
VCCTLTFDANEAYRLGLVQEVVPPRTQFERALALATTIAEQAPLGVYATLESARATVREGFAAASGALVPKVAQLFNSDDAKEGLRSFLERRPATFTGR